MLTSIESLLFASHNVHAVIHFAQDQHSIRVGVAPWDDLDNSKEAVFGLAKITSLEVYADDVDDLNMPWDIIGLDCYELINGRWRFVIHCQEVEYCFESEWPTLANR